jgi:hypothetical protein
MADFGTAVLWESFAADELQFEYNTDSTLTWKHGTLREALEITAKVSGPVTSASKREWTLDSR